MYLNLRRTSFDGRCIIDEARKYCDLDLEVVSMEGAVTQTSKILLALASHSPCLKDLLTSDTPPSRLLVPDVPTQSLHHLLNVLTQGYTTGPGSGDAIIKGMREAAKVLGVAKFPVLAFEVEGNPPAWPSDRDVIQLSMERTEAEKDRNDIVEIDTEDNEDDGVERESRETRDGELKEQSNSLKVLSMGDINKKNLNDQQNEGQPQRKRRKETPLMEVVDPKTVPTLGKVRQSSVQLDPVHHKKRNLPPPKNLSNTSPCVSKGELAEKVTAPTLRDEILSNLDKIKPSSELHGVNRKNRNLSQPITRVLPKPMSQKNRPIISGRQQSGGSFPPKSNPPVNLTEQNSDVGIESVSVRKSATHVAITSYSSTQPSTSHSCDTTGRIESASAAPPTRESKDPRKSQDPSKHKHSSKHQDPSKPQDPSKSKDPSKTKDLSKVSKMDCEVELVELKKRHNNQEVTEAVPKVLKTETEGGTGDENQNHEALDTILCGICYKSFSKNAGALAVHAETHGSEFGGNGKGRRKCTQCDDFEGDRTRLLMHMRAVHTMERLFKCEVCNASFATCASKKNHEKKHQMK